MKTIKKLLYILPLGVLAACAPEFDDQPSFEKGQADFTTFVAVGNSLTAGFQDGALFREGQVNSFPAILAEQFKELGGGEFKQPLMADGPGVGPSGTSRLKLEITADCKGELSPAPTAGAGQLSELAVDLSADGPFNNVGVPGAKSFHLGLAGYENLNPFYKRFAVTNEPIINAAVRTNASFFSLWIGANDVLSYALAGGSGTYQKGNLDPRTYGVNDITDPTYFANTYQQLAGALAQNGAKGVVANIPNVTSLPYFSAVPAKGLELSAAEAAFLNESYKSYNNGLDAAVAGNVITQNQADFRKVNFQAGSNYFVVIDSCLANLSGQGPSLPSMRQLKPGEYLTLTTPGDSLKCGGWGSDPRKPIPAHLALVKCEIDYINEATTAFNNSIRQTAAALKLAFVDANKILSEMENGLSYGGVNYTTSFATGGTFSLDGFHPSMRGYAIIANEFINAINARYEANIRKVNPNTYPGIELP